MDVVVHRPSQLVIASRTAVPSPVDGPGRGREAAVIREARRRKVSPWIAANVSSVTVAGGVDELADPRGTVAAVELGAEELRAAIDRVVGGHDPAGRRVEDGAGRRRARSESIRAGRPSREPGAVPCPPARCAPGSRPASGSRCARPRRRRRSSATGRRSWRRASRNDVQSRARSMARNASSTRSGSASAVQRRV